MYSLAKALNAPKWLQSSLIYVTKHGSQAYGTALPDSDTDIRGICIPPKPFWYGFAHQFEQFEHKGEDITIFSIRKFFQLASNANPNVLELLYTDPADHLWMNAWGAKLLEHRDLFLSQKIKHSFSGYAVGQLKRIRTHRKWLLDPPSHKPERAEFGLLETKLVPREIVGAFEALGDVSMVPADVMAVFHKERAYLNKLREWQQYENWKKTRNAARAELEAQFGYDCKHAMHLVRLMTMCREILSTGKVLVKRPDAAFLLSIRRGAWKYDDLEEWAAKQDFELNDLLKSTSLPYAPDLGRLDTLLQDMVDDWLDETV